MAISYDTFEQEERLAHEEATAAFAASAGQCGGSGSGRADVHGLSIHSSLLEALDESRQQNAALEKRSLDAEEVARALLVENEALREVAAAEEEKQQRMAEKRRAAEEAALTQNMHLPKAKLDISAAEAAAAPVVRAQLRRARQDLRDYNVYKDVMESAVVRLKVRTYPLAPAIALPRLC